MKLFTLLKVDHIKRTKNAIFLNCLIIFCSRGTQIKGHIKKQQHTLSSVVNVNWQRAPPRGHFW